MASSLLSRTTSTPSSAVSSRTCQCPSAAAVAAAVIRPSRRVQRHQLQLPLQRQLLLEQQPTAHSWVVRSSASSDTTASGSSGAPEGQVSSAIIEAMQAKIKGELGADSVVVSDVYGDGRHVSIDVISNAFEGKTSVQRQRMVYKAIWMELQETVHAVDAMTTKTPQEVSGA